MSQMGQSLAFKSMYYQCLPVSFFSFWTCASEKSIFSTNSTILTLSAKPLKDGQYGKKDLGLPPRNFFRHASIVCVILRPFLETGTSSLRFKNRAFEASVLVLCQYILYTHLNCNKHQMIRTSHRRYIITSSFTHLTEHCSNTRLSKERRN